MKLDEYEFFREATLRICGNLEIEVALFECLEYLKKEIPADSANLSVWESDIKSIRVIARATGSGGIKTDHLIPMPPIARKNMDDMQKGFVSSSWPDTDIINDSSVDPGFWEVTKYFDLENSPAMHLLLETIDRPLCSILVFGRANSVFTEQDAKVLNLIKRPLSIAMSNALKHLSELKLHDMEFFREATMRVCGSLEIEEGLRSCVEYLSQHMPADVLYLERYEEDLGSMRCIARATAVKGEKLDVLIPLPEPAKIANAMWEDALKAGTLPPVVVVNNPEEEPVTRHLLEALNEPVSSVMGLPLVIEDQLVGGITLLANGKDRFEELHAQLYANLKVPAFVAMSNTLKRREILKLKDLLADDNRYLHGELRRMSGDEIIGANFGLRDVMHKVHQVASLDSPVLLLGETGSGKDVIANTIHYSSSRSNGPFVSVNCGAIPDTLLDSELFGHEKGAFTGALSQKRGRFERADKGTIFLDEIGELPPQAQVRLLRVLQSREIERVGGDKTIPLNIRIIAATNRELEEMVKTEKFREDLWFRLNVFPIWIPPLRDRNADIPALLQHFITMKSKELNMPAIPELAPGAIDYLMQYHWPGNVRELENIVERAIILNPKGPLKFDTLIISHEKETPAVSGQSTEQEKLDDVISSHIQKILSKTEGKIHGPGGAADLLGINASTLRHRMNKLGINYGRGSRD